MNTSESLVSSYLTQLEKALAGMEPGPRRELVEDLQNHIEHERAELGADSGSEAAVRQILDRLGSPETVAAAALEDETPTPERSWLDRRRLVILGVAFLLTVVVVVLVLGLFFVSSSSTVGPQKGPAPSTSFSASQP